MTFTEPIGVVGVIAPWNIPMPIASWGFAPALVNSHFSVRYSTPFGGFMQSGIGRELGPDALDAFTEIKDVSIATEES